MYHLTVSTSPATSTQTPAHGPQIPHFYEKVTNNFVQEIAEWFVLDAIELVEP